MDIDESNTDKNILQHGPYLDKTSAVAKQQLNVALKTAIFESGKKQKRIAKLARISEAKLSHIVRGRLAPNDTEREALAVALARPQSELFPGAVAS